MPRTSIIITHSAFRFIGVPSAFESQMIQDELELYETLLAKVESGDRVSRTRLERLKEGLKERLEAWTSDRGPDHMEGERLLEQGDYAEAELCLAKAMLNGERRRVSNDMRIHIRLELGEAQRRQFRPEDGPAQPRKLDAAEETFRSALELTVLYPQPNGKAHWYYVRMFPIKNANQTVFGMMMAVNDITEKKLMEEEILGRKIQEQKMVTRAILIGEERERNKIGQELHDNINQILAGTKLYLGTARRNRPGGENIINESIQLLDSAIEEIRTLSRGKVTPMKKVNLQEILQLLIERFYETTHIKTNFVYNGSGQFIEDDLKLNIYRVVQEQLNNILKHAAAQNINILVEAGASNIRVQVTDDGKGFETSNKMNGIGLAND